jgi:hypothetical protein
MQDIPDGPHPIKPRGQHCAATQYKIANRITVIALDTTLNARLLRIYMTNAS